MDQASTTRMTDEPLHDIVQAQQQLLFQKTLLEAQSEASIDGILVVTDSGAVLSYNQRFIDLWGIPPDVIATRQDKVLIDFVQQHLTDPAEFRRRVEYLYEHPEQSSREEIALLDGRCFDRYSAPINDRGGRHYGRVWFFRDITDRKRAEEALRVSETRFRLMIEQSPLSIQIIAPGGQTLQVNKAFESLWGVTLEDLHDYNVLHDQQLVQRDIMPYLRRAVAGEAASLPPVFYAPYRGKYKDVARCVRTHVYPVKNNRGAVREVVLMHEDLTERMRAEEELRSVASHARCILWRAEIEGTPGWEQDITGEQRRLKWRVVIQDEHAAQQIVPLDVPPGRSYVLAWLDSRDPSDRRAAWGHSARALIEGASRYSHSFRCYDRNGEVRWLHEDVSVQPRGYGRWDAFGVCTDITERKRAEQALLESEQHHKEAAEFNKRLLMEVDHRVKNNLAGLMSLISLAKDRAKDVNAFAAAIESRLLGMSHVHQLLAEAGWRELSMASLVTSLLGVMKSIPQYETATLVQGPELSIPPRIALPLTMIMVEWFTNSCKYGVHSVAGGQLAVRWEVVPLDAERLVRLHWHERGGPPITGPVEPSLGTELVRSFVTRELQGSCELRFPESGADHSIEFRMTR